jgi:carbon-monoxide dehydrogenase large subunit
LWESAKLRFHHTGTLQIFTGTHSHGQSHETTFAQLAAEKLGVPIESVEVIHGDTEKTPVGMGTYGSRSLAVGGQAIVNAAEKIIAKGKKIAAHLLEASEGDIEFKDGNFTVAGTDRSKSIGEVVFAAYVPHNYPVGLEPGMEETAFYDPANFTYPSGTYICEVEVDPETGVVKIDRFVAVDDFGKVVNPMIVEGQVHGGLVQGIGQALTEGCVYDDAGQLISASYMDYSMPKADDVPSFQVALTETPCTHNTLGVKGCGEAGAIGAPPAVMNAITDAIGVRIEMPATPEKVWRALQRRQMPQAAE